MNWLKTLAITLNKMSFYQLLDVICVNGFLDFKFFGVEPCLGSMAS